MFYTYLQEWMPINSCEEKWVKTIKFNEVLKMFVIFLPKYLEVPQICKALDIYLVNFKYQDVKG